MNPDRDELAELIRTNRTVWVTNSEHREMEESQADAILAAGYRKPRTIGTREELDALPVGGIIRGKWLAEKWADEEGELWYVAGKGIRWDTEQLVQRGGLPAEVLKEDLS